MNGKQCRLCEDRLAAFLCFCQEVFVCNECISTHLFNNPSLEHKPVPLTSSELINSMRCEGPKKLGLPEQPPTKVAIARQVVNRELQRLEDFESKAMLQLAAVKQLWSAQLERTVQEVKEQLSAQVLRLTQILQQFLAETTEGDPQPASESPLRERLLQIGAEDELLHLSFDAKSVELGNLIRQSLLFEADLKRESKDQNFLYKFFGGSNLVGVFDIKSEKSMGPIIASSKFFHNACWSMAPSGHVFVTGGSLTGKSRNEALEFNPNSGGVTELQPMQIARRSHASICCGSRYYVFGGILDEERISMCERFNPRDDVWSPLVNMNERRAYLGCCEFRGAIYVGGGSEKSSMEVFSPETERFEILPLTQVAVEDNCSLLALEDSILIFHGNFRGDVSRLQANQEIVKEREMCYGNSWSNCLPLVHDDSVYLLRSDSVFMYNLRTGASSYVAHLPKTSKRKEYE